MNHFRYISFLAAIVILASGGLVLMAGQPAPPRPKPVTGEAAKPEPEEPKGPRAGKLPDGVVATVNGEPVKIEELQKFLLTTIGASTRGIGQYIDLMLIEREARKYDITIADTEINKAVDKEMERIEKRFGDKLDDLLKREYLFTKDNLRKVFYFGKRRELLMEKTVKLWMLEPERIKEQIESRFKQRFRKEKEYFRARRITLSPDKEIKDKEQLARRLATDIKSGKITFEEAAKKHSADRYKDNGGDMGYFTADMFRAQVELMNNMRALKAGEISEPFKTGLGWNIVKLEAHHPANTIELKHVEGFLKAEIERGKPDRRAQGEFMKKLKDSAEIIVDWK